MNSMYPKHQYVFPLNLVPVVVPYFPVHVEHYSKMTTQKPSYNRYIVVVPEIMSIIFAIVAHPSRQRNAICMSTTITVLSQMTLGAIHIFLGHDF